MGRVIVPGQPAVLQAPSRVAYATRTPTTLLLAKTRPAVGLLPIPIVVRERTPSKGGTTTTLDGPRPAPGGTGKVARPRSDQPTEELRRGAFLILTRRLLALGPT